jgi:hypothetical protein
MGRVWSTLVTLAKTTRRVNEWRQVYAFTHHLSIVRKLTEQHLGCQRALLD